MKKIKILELDITNIIYSFVSFSPGIYQKTLTVPVAVQEASFWYTNFSGSWNIDSAPVSIGSVRINNLILGSVDSIEELREQDGAFHFDIATQILYFALYDFKNAWQYNGYKIGETSGFISQAQMQLINGEKFPVSAYLGATFYEPRLNDDDISIEEGLDDQGNGIFVFDEITASLRNADGKFDLIRGEVTGNEARILIANISDTPEEEEATGYPYKLRADISDFNIIRRGVIEDVSYSDPDSPAIKAIDPRSDWDQKIGTTILSVSEFPDLEDNLIGKRKPIIVGNVNGTPCVRVEPRPLSAANTEFLICDTSIGDIGSVSGIYFDGKISGSDVDRFLAGGEYSVNTSTGVLTVNNYNSGDAFFYGVGVAINETVAVTLFLLDTYANLAYIPSNFNKTEIEQIRNLGYLTHVYVDKSGEKLSSVIEKLVIDINVDFFQQGSPFTMRLANQERPSTEEVKTFELSDNPAPWVNDRTETIKTISVGYNRDYRTDTFDTYYDDSREQEAIDNNRRSVDKVIETNLLNSGNVASIYDVFYERYSKPSRTVTINRLRPFMANLSDFVLLKIERDINGTKKSIFPRAKYKIVSINHIDDTAEAVYFSDQPEPYLMQGLLSFGTPSFGAPRVVPVYIPYSGIPSFSYASFGSASSVGGSYELTNPVTGSGYVSSVTQQIGE